MGILTMIIVGFIVGLLARALKPGNDRMGIIMTTLVGIAGSFLAGWAGQAMGLYRPGQPVECLDQPETLSGESVLAGFTLNLSEIWQPPLQ